MLAVLATVSHACLETTSGPGQGDAAAASCALKGSWDLVSRIYLGLKVP